MKQEKQIIVTAVILITGISAFAQQEKYHDTFFEKFNRSSSKNFQPIPEEKELISYGGLESVLPQNGRQRFFPSR